MGTIERRFGTSSLRFLNPIENASDSPGVVTGYSAKYSYNPTQNLSEPLSGFRERLAPGCFDKSLRGNCLDMRCDYNHDQNFPLGIVRNKSLSLSSDSTGLLMRCVLPNTSYARDLAENIRTGNISQQSFAFECDDDDWGDCDDPDNPGTRTRLRTVRSAKLHGVSIVTSPAYRNTDAQIHVSSLDRASRSRDFAVMFPQGPPQSFPQEIRANLFRTLDQTSRRRSFTNLVLGL